MKSKILKTLVVCLLVVGCVLALSACFGASATGKYFLWEDDALSTDYYIEIKGDQWTDEEGLSGSVVVDGESVLLMMDVFGSEEIMYECTLRNGVLAVEEGFGEMSYYCKQGKTPEDFNVGTSDGESDGTGDNGSGGGGSGNGGSGSGSGDSGSGSGDSGSGSGDSGSGSGDSGSGNGGNGGSGDAPAPNPGQVTVTYDANGGFFSNYRETITQTVYEGSRLTAPGAPHRDDYVFVGWYQNANLADRWNFDTDTVQETITLYAKWQLETRERTVTFYLNYEGGGSEQKSTVNGLVAYTASREGYVFNGWWLSSGQTASGEYILSRKWNINDVVTSDNLVLYAEWVEASTVDSQLPAPSVSVDGYVFSWDPIDGAVRYTLQVYYSATGEEMDSVSTTNTSWTFPSSYDAGYYNVKIRAIGDGTNTVNSSYVTKQYEHHILGSISITGFDISTSRVTWSEVTNATAYELYVDGEEIAQVTGTSYDLSFLDAGSHEVRVVATRSGYQSSSASQTVKKLRLRTPEVHAVVDKEEACHYLYWDAIAYADTYVLSLNGTEVRLENTTYFVIYNSASYWNSNGEITLTVSAFDSGADYLISNPTGEIALKKLYTLTLEKNDESAGTTSATGGMYTARFTVQFNLNGYGATGNIAPQIVKGTTGLSYPSVIPTREGYLFRGWYTSSTCQTLYDFTQPVCTNMTLYAGWYRVPQSGNISQGLNIYSGYNSSGSAYYVSTEGTAASSANYAYFTALRSGTYTLYYKNGSSSSNYGTYLYVYNATQGTNIKANTKITSTSYSSVTMTLSAGDVVYVRTYAYSSSSPSTFYFYVTGARLPQAGGVAYDAYLVKGDATTQSNLAQNIVACGEQITVTAQSTDDRYVFDGWYLGDTRVSDRLTYTFTMPMANVTYQARWIFYSVSASATEGGSITVETGATRATVTFDLNGGDGTAPTSQTVTATEGLTYPALPTREGYLFGGWYKDAACTVLCDFSATVSGDMTLYAKWVAYSGTGVLPLNTGTSLTVPSKSATKQYYAFVPLTSGSVTIYSSGSSDTYGYLYNSSKTQLTSNDDSGDGNNFRITYTVTAGTLYYLAPCGYSSTVTTMVYITAPTLADGGCFDESGETGQGSSVSDMRVKVGATVTMTATTDTGYNWLGWYEGETLVSASTVYTFTMGEANRTLVAKWDYYTVTTGATLNGETGSGGTYTLYSDEKISDGTSVTLTATTDAGYNWLGWYEGNTLVSASTTYTFTMGKVSRVLVAKWDYYTVTATNSDTAMGSITSYTDEKVSVGEEVTLTATPKTGYSFVGWYEGDALVSESATYTFTMGKANRVLVATWDYYTVTTSATLNGSAGSGGSYTSYSDKKISDGTSVTLTATTNTGYNWLGWYEGETLVSASATYTFTMGKVNRTLVAKWDYYTVTTTNSDTAMGSITSYTNKKISAGEEVTLTATPKTGYSFVGWYEGDALVSESTTYTFTMGKVNRTFVAKWDYYTVTTSATVNGVTGSGGTYTTYSNTKASNGTSVTLTATTNAGYNWLGWYEGETLVSASTTYTFTMGKANRVFVAKWDYYTVTTTNSDTAMGSITTYTDEKVSAGKSVTLTATPKTGYSFVGWYEGETLVSASASYTFKMEKVNRVFVAKWDYYTVTTTNSDTAMGSITSYTDEKVSAGKSVTLTATPQTGYNFVGWYEGGALVSDSATYTFTMGKANRTFIAKWDYYTVTTSGTVNGSMGSGGSYTAYSAEKISKGTSVTLTATTDAGYNWLGWYEGETLVSESATYTFTMGKVNRTLVAKWDYYTVTVSNEDTAKGTTTTYTNEKVSEGTSVTLKVTAAEGYAFLGWYEGDTCLSTDGVYTFTMTKQSRNIVAKWGEVGLVAFALNTNGNAFAVSGKGTGSENVTIPATYAGLPVTGIQSSAFEGCTSLTSITIPSSVTSIGSYAFRDCISLTSITIPDSVTSIGSSAFSGCYKLVEVYDLSEHLTITAGSSGNGYVGYYAKVVHTSATEESCLHTTGDGYVFFENGDEVYLVDYVGTDTTLTLPDQYNGKTYGIYQYAFSECKNLTSITIPSSVTSIGFSAFSGCSSLVEMTIPFVGGEAGKTSSSTYQYPFGYIFGTTSYTGGTAVTQSYYYSTSSTTSSTYYIPASLRCVTVTGGNILRGAFYGCSMLTEVTLPSSVTGIGSYAFRGCTGLTSITIPSGVTSIGDYAFYNCTGLTSIAIPEGVTSIGSSAFSGCYKLVEVYDLSEHLTITAGSSGNGYLVYYAKVVHTSATEESCLHTTGDGYVFFENGDEVYLMGYVGTDTALTLPDKYNGKVYGIYQYAFSGCTSLTSITIPSSVTSIGNSTFYGCRSLASITIPSSVTSIGDDAFYGCTGLTAVHISDLSAWCGISFYDAYTNPLSYAGNLYLGDTLVTELVIPEGVTSIGDYAFRGCTGLTSITIPSSVTSIGSSAFYGCSGLTSITIPSGVTSIGNSAFRYCTGLASVAFEAGSQPSIAAYAFLDCTGLNAVYITDISAWCAMDFGNMGGVNPLSNAGHLYLDGKLVTELVVPDNVTSIGQSAFIGCTSLTSITIPSSVTSIGNYAFSGCTSLTSVTFEAGSQPSIAIAASAFYGCTGLTTITVAEGNTKYHSAGNCLIETATKKLILGCQNSVIPTDGSVTSIGSYAFEYCTGLTSITIPSSVKSIGYYAFAYCKNLTSITIPSSVTSIGSYAFRSCTSLTSVTFEGDSQLISIFSYAFEGCTGLTSITIPSSVTEIGAYAFSGCTNLTNVYVSTTGWYYTRNGYNYTVTLTNSSNAASNLTGNCRFYHISRNG